ncbi:hypothetical protein [Brevundimonas sp. NIBR11]|uniref:hypothetical protein n=1 Tax=Brevundimonas sp. NIBR11 TaxID=3015999 RepID=UPI0022F0DB3A|nr:hypothetical protein [Brevundimonas sp. NIBR11]WGM32882.1 hypothetical protein KKHFBJBL_03137 [Brevundimonas sp. NIBR11]
MTVSIKTAALVLALTACAGPVLAQQATQDLNRSRSLAPSSSGAAATLPNTFDAPAAPTLPRPAPEPAPAPQVSDAQMAEAALRSVIDQFRAADIDERLFTPGVATQLNAQLPNYSRLIRGYGAVQSIEPQGAANGVGQFLVIFDNAATQWQVGLEDGGLVAALRFREAPPESSDPAAAPATSAAPGA